MKMIKKTIALSLGFVLMGGAASFAQSLADAKKAIDAEQYQKATSMLKTLVNSQAKEGDNYYNLGRVYLLVEEADSAKSTFTKGTVADPKNALNYVGLGQVELNNGNTAGAKVNFDKAVELGKKDYVTYMQIGRAYFEQPKPDYATALPFLQKADELDAKDKDAEVFIALGDYWASQINNAAAYEQYLRALDIDPNLKRVKVQIGKMFKMAYSFPEAEDKVKEVISADANYGPAYRELAEINMGWSFRDPDPKKAEAKRTEALENMRKYLDLTDKSFDSRYRYAQFLVYASDWNTLASELTTLKTDPANPKNFVINRLQGYSAVEGKNFDRGVKYLTELFTRKEDASRVLASDYLYLGKAYQGMGNDSLAVLNLTKGVQLDSTKVEDLAALGLKLFNEKKYGKAAQVYADVINANSKNPSIAMNLYYLGLAHYWNYATLNNEKKNPDKQLLKEADSAFARVLTLVPEYEDALWYRVQSNRLQDDPQAPTGLAMPFYEKFIELVTVTKPDKATKPANQKKLVDAYNNMAAFYSATDKDKAIEFLNKTLAIDPQNNYALETLKIINAQAAPPKKAPIK